MTSDFGLGALSAAASASHRAARWVLVPVSLAAIALFRRHFTDLERFIALARQAEPRWLLLALLLRVTTYLAVARAWQRILRRAGVPQPLRRLFPIAVSKLFADQGLPGAGLGDHILLVDRSLAIGTSRSTAIAALLISMLGYYLAYAFLALAMLLVLWVHHRATPFMVGLVSALLLIALAIPSFALWLRHRGSQPLSSAWKRLGPVPKLLATIGEAPPDLIADRRLLGRVSALNLIVFMADSATMMVCLLALGLPLQPATAFLAFMAGSIAATLAPLPFGLGSFEVSSTAMMRSLGVPFETALTATLLLRGLTLWLPLLPSLFLMRSGGQHR